MLPASFIAGDCLNENVTTIMCIGTTGVVASHSFLGPADAGVYKEFFERVARELRAHPCPPWLHTHTCDGQRPYPPRQEPYGRYGGFKDQREAAPPHSPSLNPIESLHVKIKSMVKKEWLTAPPDDKQEAMRQIEKVVAELAQLTRDKSLVAYYHHMRKEVAAASASGKLTFNPDEVLMAEDGKK